MINKQGLIFLTLTSLILVLSVYYVTMPNELLLTTNSLYKDEDLDKSVNVDISNMDTISTMKNVLTDERMKKIQELNDKLINSDLSILEKNNIYDEIKTMNKIETMEENIEKIIKEEFNLSSFVKIKDDVIEITINSSKHDINLAAKIMTCIEKQYKDMYISVNFKD